ncbi:hypothetical protein DV736_g6494, partial [Chaetothyriales sp. CBS 134916]
MLATLATASLALYFLLNLLVTVSNRAIIQSTACPYLLTVSHATATFLLPVHQTIRAVAPLLTIAISILLRLKTLSSYRAKTYLSLLPIVFGVVVASASASTTDSATTTHSTQRETALFGVCITLLGAVTAVLKTIATHSLQADLAIQSYELIHITAPLAATQGLVAAWLHREFTMLPASLHFEANKRCGPLTMGVAANLKQVAVLFVPDGHAGTSGPARNVVVGSLATVLGGLWYAVAQSK